MRRWPCATLLFRSPACTRQNTLLMFGGITMCFITSWRLSMVAYTTVLPIMHATEAYAKWSGRINREIFQHYSEANAQASCRGDAIWRRGDAISSVREMRSHVGDRGDHEHPHRPRDVDGAGGGGARHQVLHGRATAGHTRRDARRAHDGVQ